MPAQPDIAALDRELRALAGEGRPFLCQGSPFGCTVFLVGINPATDTPFWPYWSLDRGCDKDGWLQAYRDKHGRLRPTRERIERLCNAMSPTRALEANVFHLPSDREADLTEDRRSTVVFDYLLRALQPRVMFVHGRSAIEHLERLTHNTFKRGEFTPAQYLGLRFDVIAGHHLSYQWSYAAVEQLGLRLRERCARSNAIYA